MFAFLSVGYMLLWSSTYTYIAASLLQLDLASAVELREHVTKILVDVVQE